MLIRYNFNHKLIIYKFKQIVVILFVETKTGVDEDKYIKNCLWHINLAKFACLN